MLCRDSIDLRTCEERLTFTMARNRPTSQKCALSTCKNRVSYDSQFFPFCHHHYHIKQSRSSIVDSYARGDIEEAYVTLYDPERATMSKEQASTQQIALSAHVSPDVATHAVETWLDHTSDCDMTVPSEASQRRDAILDDIRNGLPRSYNARFISCENPAFFLPNGTLVRGQDHRVLAWNQDEFSPTVVCDAATSAPAQPFFHDSVNNHYGSGENVLGDGLSVMPMVEYAQYSGVQFDTLTDEATGEMLWDNREHSSAEKLEQHQRELVEKYGEPIAPEPVYLTSAQDYEDHHRQPTPEVADDNHDDYEDITLEQLLAEE